METLSETEPKQNKRNLPQLFKPGQSGNPGGRPKGKSLTTLLRLALKEKAKHFKTGEPILLDGKEATWEELLIARSLHAGIVKGDEAIHKMIYDRLEGKPSQSIKFKDESEGKENLFDKVDKIHSILTHGNETPQGENSGEETV